MTNFKINQKVICVSETKNNPYPFEIQLPIKGNIYTIREIRKNAQGRIGLFLKEIVNKPVKHKNGFGEQGFVIECFRPLQYDSATSEILAKFKITEEKCDVEIKPEVVSIIECTK